MNHPLFPNAPEDDPREIAWIHVTRFERTGQVWFPRAFPADELHGLDDIAGMFGGGSYELFARAASAKNNGVGVIIDRYRVTLPGEPRPLVPEEEAAAAPAAAPAPAIPHGPMSPEAMMLAFMQMQQSAQVESNKVMIAMITAIVPAIAGQKSDTGGAALIQAMADMSKSHTEALAKLYESRGGGGGGGGGDANPMEALIQGMELGKSMSEGQQQEPSDLAVVMQGFTAAMNAPRPDNQTTPAIKAANGSS